MLRLVVEDEPPGPPAVPGERECLGCFVERMVLSYGCSDGLRWTGLWRDRRAPRARALEQRLERSGGYCDCEVLANAFTRRADLVEIADAVGSAEQHRAPDPPPCRGVRKGSTRPCTHWWE